MGAEIAAVPRGGATGQKIVRVRGALNNLRLGNRNAPTYLQNALPGSVVSFGLGVVFAPIAFDWAMVSDDGLFSRQVVSTTFEF